MGGNVTKQVKQIVNESITNVIVKNMTSCAMGISQLQQIVAAEGANLQISNVTMNQGLLFNGKCAMSIKVDSNLINKIVASIKSKLSSTAGLGNISANISDIKMANILKKNITTDIIQKCVSSAAQVQTIKAGKNSIVVISDATLKQSAKVFNSCIMSTLNNMKIAEQLLGKVSEKTVTVTKGLGDMLKTLMGPFNMIIIIVLIFSFIFVYIFIRNFIGGGNKR